MNWTTINIIVLIIGILFGLLAYKRGSSSDGSGGDFFIWALLALICVGGSLISMIVKSIAK